jgi:hypothetical protein
MPKVRRQLTPERIAMLRALPCIHMCDAEIIFQIGRNRLYDFMRDGRVRYTKIGGSTLLSVPSLEALVRPPDDAAPLADVLRRRRP